MSDITVPKPTSSHILWGGAVEIYCFGASHDWSLSGRTPMEAEWKNPGIRSRMHQLSDIYGCKHIYAPNPSRFNAEIAKSDKFTVDWAEGRVLRGPFADGVLLTEPNTAFAVSSADCPTGILQDSRSGTVVVAHAGLKSMYDVGKAPVAYRMYEALQMSLGSELSNLNLRGFVACGIGTSAYHFETAHPKFSKENALICERLVSRWKEATLELDGLLIDLATLFRIQAEAYCIARSNIGFDGVCTHNDTGSIGKPLWHSNWRGDRTRNLVLVIRR